MSSFSKEPYTQALLKLSSEDMIPAVVHDLRNRLTAILGAASFIEGAVEKPINEESLRRIKNCVAVILHGAVDVSNMVDATLDADRIRRNKDA